ncbi:MAG: hypothetical protein QOF01_2639, partial [Thermomicrobiales bacterium]|nr:hypothetical protein [Thermomicrobiales bacterium]
IFENADLRNARLVGSELNKASFTGFYGPANLNGASIYRAEMREADFDGVSLQSVRGFADKTDLRGARLWRTDLSGVRFGAMDAGSLEGAYFYRATLDRTPLRRDHIGKWCGEEYEARESRITRHDGKSSAGEGPTAADWWLRASESYRSLTSNFSGLGRSEDSSWAHFQQRKSMGQHHLSRLRDGKELSAAAPVTVDFLY